MSGVLRRVGAFFLEPAQASPERAVPTVQRSDPVAAAAPPRAAVLGAPGVVVPVAAACAGELRARCGAPAAVVCVWRPVPSVRGNDDDEPATGASPAGATTPGAHRIAAHFAPHGLEATSCGRLAWLTLDAAPARAAEQARRCMALADVPLVLALAGARPAAFEPLLAELDLAVAVLAAEAGDALRELALTSLSARVRHLAAPLPPGPPRWAAIAGLARLRSLPEDVA